MIYLQMKKIYSILKIFIARELLEIDVSTGEKIYREVKKSLCCKEK